ncbi:MAG: RIP metalloprotease RseP [candidate division Zixibacteria bacterium]|nr:RIP metalloprotease RseP [candidate division Zixibacteria bacterium]
MLDSVLSSLVPVVSAVFVLAILIFFHELGHFLIAKRAGIRVDKFSLGFPPTILKKKFGGTEYCLGAIPLGGYVKMAGETPGEEVTGSPDEFMSKSVGARALVVSAGPIMNFIIAFLILWGVYYIEGEPVIDTERAVIGIVAPDSPALEAGLKKGDVITSINDQAVTGFSSMARLIEVEVEKPIAIEWLRDSQIMSATVTTMVNEMMTESGEKIKKGIIGVGQHATIKDLGIFEAASRGFDKTVFFTTMVFDFLKKLLTFQVSAKLIGGPVFIMQMAGETARLGFTTLLSFMAMLSVNLAVLNILPIPVLDGGHLLFLLIEKIKGSPVSMNARIITQQIGFVVLLITIIMVTYNDIARIFTG